MHPPPDSEVNPYAPPAPEVPATAANVAFPIPPASVKWTWGIVSLIALAECYFIGRIAITRGWKWFAEDGMTAAGIVNLTIPLCAAVLIIAGRRTAGYGSGVAVLGWLCFLLGKNVWILGEAGNIGGGIVFFLLLVSPLLVLFYRFTFGLPSRRYYRVGSQKSSP